MLPESIKAEIEAKGGLAGAPEPQGNGTTIYRAVTGDYVVVDDATGQPRMRGFSPPATPNAQQPAPVEPPAPTAPPGSGRVNQQQMEAILQQAAPNGDTRRLEPIYGSKTRTKPGDTYNPSGTQIQVQTITWIDRGTGMTVEAEVEPDGGYTVTHNGIKQSNQGAAIKPEDQQAGTKEGDTRGPQNGRKREVYRGGQWVLEDNPLYENPDRVGKPTGNTRTRSDNGTTTKETEYLLPDGSKEWRTQTEQSAPDRVGKPTGSTRQGTKDGKTVKEVEYVLPDGTKEWRAQEAPAEGTTVDLQGAPQLDLSSPERARASYRELFAFVDRKVRDGTLTAEKAKAYLTGPHQAVSDMVSEATEQRQTGENLRRDQLTERSQDMSQTGNRLSFGQQAAQTAIKTSGDLIKAAEGGESTIVPLMVLQAGMSQAMGGFRESPNVTLGSGMLPRVAQVAGEGFTPPSTPSSTPMSPEQAAAVGGPPAIPMTPERVQGIMANPVFRPSPPVAAAPVSSAPPPPLTSPMQAPGSGPTMRMRDPWGNELDLTQQQLDNRPGGASDLTPVAGAPQAMIPAGVLRNGLGVGARTADDLERELLSEGFSPEEIRMARRNAERRAGVGVAV